MSKRVTLKQYQAKVEEQGQTLLAAIRSAASGNFDVPIETANGMGVLTELAEEVQSLLLALQNQTHSLVTIDSQQTDEAPSQNLVDRLVATSQQEAKTPIEPQVAPIMLSAVEQDSLVVDGSEAEGTTLAVPINFGDKIIGVMGFRGDGEMAWHERDLAAVSAIIEQVGLALENQRLFDQTQDALAETLATQQRFVREGWSQYTVEDELDDEVGDLPQQSLNAMQTAIEEQGLIIESTPDEGASLAVSVNYAGEVIGILGFNSEEVSAWDEEDIAAVEVITEQLALALENQRLFDRTQAALTETQMLYDINGRLNAASTTEDLIEAASLPAIVTKAHSSTLFLFELNDEGQPIAMEMGAYWVRQQDPEIPPMGTWLSLDDLPLMDLFRDSFQPILIDDVNADTRLHPAIRHMFQQTQTVSAAIVPLRYGGSWTGIIIVRWDMPYHFTQRDQNIYQSLATQTAIALSSQLLFEEVQERAAQSGKLAQIEAELSQANDEDEILKVLVPCVDEPHIVSLHYVDTDEAGTPITAQLMSQWGPITSGDEDLTVSILLQVSQEILSTLSTPLIIENVDHEDRLDDMVKQIAKRLDIAALVLLPLRSGGQWRGLILFSWPKPYKLSAIERFLFQQLVDPVAAVVASRRALTETEILYQANSELVSAQGYVGILEVLRKYTVLGLGHDVSLNYFDIPWTTAQKPEMAVTMTRWSQLSPQLIISQYRLETYPSIDPLIHITRPLVLEDMVGDARLDESLQQLFITQLEAKTAVFIPLILGTQQLGYLSALYRQPTPIPEAEVRLLMGLAGQATVACERVRLLEETERRAQREQILREITAQVRGASDIESIMRTAVNEIGRTLGRRVSVYLNTEQPVMEQFDE